jgi:hypothetical protein
MAYPQTESLVSYGSGKNSTMTSLSTNILITVDTEKGPLPVGAVQSLTINESRPVKFIDEIGTDGHIDSAPHGSTTITGNCQRIRFEGARIAEAFHRGFVHVSAQVYPFDIIIFDKSRKDEANQTTTVIKNVWIKSINHTLNQNDWIITEAMDWEAEYIFSHKGGGSNAATGGIRKFLVNDTITPERLADKGEMRGSLDYAGLLDLDQTSYKLY